ncbi:MAG: MFS transporter [Thermoplasmata archaeon]
MEPQTLENTSDTSAESVPENREAEPRIHPDVWAISVTSLFSDWSYEMVLPILPFFLIFTLGATPFLVGLIDGAAQFAQSSVQSVAGSRWATSPNRKVQGSFGYLATTLGHGLLAIATLWPEVLVFRVSAWIGRGSRQPIKKAIVANATSPANQGIAFGLEQTLDSVGAVLGTVTAVVLLVVGGLGAFRTIFAVSVIPGFVAVVVLLVFVKDSSSRRPVGSPRPPSIRWRDFPPSFRLFIVAEIIFGLGYFSILLALLRVGENLLPASGGSVVAAVLAALLLYLLYNLIYTGMSYPAGRWADRSPGLGLVALSFLLFAVVDLLLIDRGGLLLGILAFTAAGVQVGLQGVTESAWVARKMPAQLAGPAFGWLGMVQGIAILVGSLLVGGLWTYVSAPLAFGVSAVLSVAGAALLLPLIVPHASRPASAALP